MVSYLVEESARAHPEYMAFMARDGVAGPYFDLGCKGEKLKLCTEPATSRI